MPRILVFGESIFLEILIIPRLNGEGGGRKNNPSMGLSLVCNYGNLDGKKVGRPDRLNSYHGDMEARLLLPQEPLHLKGNWTHFLLDPSPHSVRNVCFAPFPIMWFHC